MQFHRLASALVFALASQSALAIPTVGFVAPVGAVAVGDTFELLLQGTGFDLTSDNKVINNVTGGQKFNFSYNSAVLEILSVSIDTSWTFASGNKIGTVDNVGGTLTGIAFGTFPATTNDSFAIAHITFRALGAGEGLISLTGGEIAARVDSISGSKILSLLENTTVAVVPEPAEWVMLLAGLGLIGWRMNARNVSNPSITSK